MSGLGSFRVEELAAVLSEATGEERATSAKEELKPRPPDGTPSGRPTTGGLEQEDAIKAEEELVFLIL